MMRPSSSGIAAFRSPISPSAPQCSARRERWALARSSLTSEMSQVSMKQEPNVYCRLGSTLLLWALLLASFTLSAMATVKPFPRIFHTENIKTNGATIHVRVGGTGPAVVMLHGFGDTGDMWEPLAAALVKSHTVVVPDLRGMGLSSHPEGGYDKKTEAQDIAAVLDALKIEKTDLVTHD